MKPKPNLKKIAKADDKIATAADEMIKGPLWMIEQILRKHEQTVMEVMAEQQQEIRRLEDERDALQARIEELQQICRDAYEVYAGSEGMPTPETAAEAYVYQLLMQMKDEIARGLK
jgi:flagellar motility protein MotE (MotC chaperone)